MFTTGPMMRDVNVYDSDPHKSTSETLTLLKLN